MNRIKQLRNEKGINQDTLSKLLGIEIAGISKLETGRVPLKDDYILKLSEYFGVTTDYLLGKSDVRNFDKNIQGVEKNSGVPAVVFIYGTIPAGVPIEMIEDIIDTEEVPIEMTKGDKQLFRTSYKR